MELKVLIRLEVPVESRLCSQFSQDVLQIDLRVQMEKKTGAFTMRIVCHQR